MIHIMNILSLRSSPGSLSWPKTYFKEKKLDDNQFSAKLAIAIKNKCNNIFKKYQCILLTPFS